MSLCYDATGNRTSMTTNSTGTSNHCDEGTPTGTASPTPSPTSSSSNSGPSTTDDTVSGQCGRLGYKNVVANDSDPEGDTPITLTGISYVSGGASASVYSSTSVQVTFGPEWDVSYFTYTVQDSLGNSSTGQLTVSTSSCDTEPF